MCIERCGGEPNDDCIYEPDEHHAGEWDDDDPRCEREVDSNGREYRPWSGSKTPSDGRCNALLANYEERYGEPRYCTAFPMDKFENGSDEAFCHNHKHRAGLMERAKDLFKHGLDSKSIIHSYDKLNPNEKLVALGTFDSLVENSVFDFDTDVQSHYIDFADVEDVSEELEREMTDDGELPVEIPVPNENVHRCLALYHAAIDEVKKIKINETIFTEGLTTEIPTEHGSYDDEHPLNLPYSRLVKDHKEHLEYGGVMADEKDEAPMEVNGVDELVLDVEPDPEATSQEAKDMPMNEVALSAEEPE